VRSCFPRAPAYDPFLEQELAEAIIKGSNNIDEQRGCKEQNRGAVSLEQGQFVGDQEPSLVEQEETCCHEQNRGL
jgi:hypothetical protein